MASQSLSVRKIPFLALHTDVRFLIYDEIFSDLEARLAQTGANKLKTLRLNLQPQDDIGSLYHTCPQLRSEIDKWLLSKSKSSLHWTTDYGFFAPENTTFQLKVSWKPRQSHPRAAIVAHKRRVFSQFCRSPYRNEVRKVEIILLAESLRTTELCRHVGEIIKDIALLQNVEFVEIVYSGDFYGRRLWEITDQVANQTGLRCVRQEGAGRVGGYIRFAGYGDNRQYGKSKAFEEIICQWFMNNT